MEYGGEGAASSNEGGAFDNAELRGHGVAFCPFVLLRGKEEIGEGKASSVPCGATALAGGQVESFVN